MVLPESADVRTFDLGDCLVWYRSDAAGRFYFAPSILKYPFISPQESILET
jgi:hypothetical protein